MKIPKTLTATAHVTAADDGARTISGEIVAFGVDSSHGIRFTGPDALTAREPVKRVKLLVDHDHGQPVGYMTALTLPSATFTVAPGPAGDKALDDARNGLRDGLSVGFRIVEAAFDDADTLVIESAELYEVSLCAIPAFADAQVTDVAAAMNHNPKGHPMQKNTTPNPAPEDEGTPTVTQTVDPAPGIDADRFADAVRSLGALASLPGEHRQAAAPATTQPRARGFRAVVRDVSAALAAGDHNSVRAALSDVVPADDTGAGLLRDSWIGELWTASKSVRPLIDAMSSAPLGTGTKVKGWRWEDKPTVDEYAGDKTAIHSSKVKTVPAEAPVHRNAGGWDIDRIFLDLGEPGFLEAFWTAAVEDYRRDTEAYTLTRVKADAGVKSLTASALLPALGELGSTFARLGASLDSIFIGADLFDEYTAMTQSEVPFWLANATGVGLKNGTASVADLNIRTLPELGGSEILALDRRASTHYEKTPPVRVNAVDLPRGGVDLGLFGYSAVLVNDPRAVVVADLAAAGGGEV